MKSTTTYSSTSVRVPGCNCCRLCSLNDSNEVHDYGGHSMDGHGSGSEHAGYGEHGAGGKHAGHGADHTGHEMMFRKRFFISAALSVFVLFWSETIQGWFNFTAPEFHGSKLIVPVLATFIFVDGGLPAVRALASCGI